MTRSQHLTLMGNDGMQLLVEQFCALLRETHPDARFHVDLRGSSTAIPALASGASDLAPMSRLPWRGDAATFRSARGYQPTSIRVGYAGHGPRVGAKTPPAIYVHKDNPLAGLAVGDLARVFCPGRPEGDITFWDQLGLEGRWTGRRIHVYGLRDDGKYATGFRDTYLHAPVYVAHYETLDSREAVIRAVADDPFGIGAIGWLETAKVSDAVRILPLSRTAGEAFRTPCLDHVAAGDYPLSAPVAFYFDLPKGGTLTPLIRDFLTLALSGRGQAIVADMTRTREGYVPLCDADLLVERNRLSQL
ncbi:phosphate ABC transporter substrate-binding protein [Azorhizobium oxalatiphilum]|uniref:Phosphate ABC transporter substrate-binding protein n=1 Tax=Azorhizobium oxalatiphilum TaxID=980631 RepID=A0A917C2K2_9HYPH|nr:substrate-binding domain-containing protein [Azorhizobium oxalatiphilum]GGF68744.1 phosphate ABC transporter substrate-binding protein [Azorhizobium oxalatiphilum]